MRTLIYDSWFKTTEETTKALAWISFPNLLPTYFAKECLFSLAFVVGKPVQLDLAIINRTRPSCARVKVLVDLKGEFPKSVIMDIVNEATGKIKKEVVIINMITSPSIAMNAKCKVTTMMNAKKTSTRKSWVLKR